MISVVFTMKGKALSTWDELLRVLDDNYGHGGRMVEIDTFLEEGSQEARLVARFRAKTDWIIEEDAFVFDDLVARSVLASYEVRDAHVTRRAELQDPMETRYKEMRQVFDLEG